MQLVLVGHVTVDVVHYQSKVSDQKACSCFFKEFSSAHQACIYLIHNTAKAVIFGNIVIKITAFYLDIFFYVIFSCDQSKTFSIITPVFSVTWSFRNHSNMLICCSRNVYYYYHQYLKQLSVFFNSLMNRKIQRSALEEIIEITTFIYKGCFK